LLDDVSNQQLNLIQLNVVASWQLFHHERENLLTFFDFRLSHGINILQVRWKSLWCIHTEFSYESPGERIVTRT